MNSQNLSLMIVTFSTKASSCHGNYGRLRAADWSVSKSGRLEFNL